MQHTKLFFFISTVNLITKHVVIKIVLQAERFQMKERLRADLAQLLH